MPIFCPDPLPWSTVRSLLDFYGGGQGLLCDNDWRCAYATEGALTLLGWNSEELAQWRLTELMTADDQARLTYLVANPQSQQAETRISLSRRDGSLATVALSAMSVAGLIPGASTAVRLVDRREVAPLAAKLDAAPGPARGLEDRDPVSGLATQSALARRLALAWRRASTLHEPVSVMVLSLRGLEGALGKPQAALLKDLGQRLMSHATRQGDMWGHFDPVTIVGLFPAAPEDLGASLALQLRRSLAQWAFQASSAGLQVRWSLAVDTFDSKGPTTHGPSFFAELLEGARR